MYIYNFLLRMTDSVTSMNIDLSFWNILYGRRDETVACESHVTVLNIYGCPCKNTPVSLL
jgi:hypothetical protein